MDISDLEKKDAYLLAQQIGANEELIVRSCRTNYATWFDLAGLEKASARAAKLSELRQFRSDLFTERKGKCKNIENDEMVLVSANGVDTRIPMIEIYEINGREFSARAFKQNPDAEEKEIATPYAISFENGDDWFYLEEGQRPNP